jgi:light-regulated signal transduction histidine kinase (bacteriophytochrome)
LARSNAELEQFAYVASHDLQEPLRKIQAFGDRLKSKYGEALGERGGEYLQRMQNAAKRMQTLINDLLVFSRVTTKGQPFIPVDLAQVAREVVSDLDVCIERVGGHVELGDLPNTHADPLQMRQLLQNLISNGLKFHKEGTPTVKVYGQLLDGMCRLTVEDNGIGFDEKYLDRIFTIFQRLHGRSEYEGTGVGLAICRKIVERHGGTIAAKSAPGQGATFIVTLPVKQPKENKHYE